jgi:hypothetical protein
LARSLSPPRSTALHCACLQITVVNRLPADWPTVLDGITIHWHGFHMKG